MAERAGDETKNPGDFCGVCNLKVRLLPHSNSVAVHHDRFNFLLRLSHRFCASGRDEGNVNIVEIAPLQSLANRRVRHENDIVLVIPDDVGTFAGHDTNNFKGDVFDADASADRVRSLEEFLDDCLADDADFVGVIDVPL